MVHQITTRNVIDLEVCSVSYQRHCTSLLNKRSKLTNTLCKKPVMAENTDRHPLPVVELRPFSKKVWRREKSLPDFYEKKRPEEVNTNSSNSTNGLEIDPTPNRLVRELTETRRNIETRQNTFDSALGKYRNHPKAEFLHESNRAWRKQDLIPSFITRFERTKTSLESISKDSSALQRISFENPSMFENALKREPNPMIKIKGGKMNQQIHRRHFLYLNPLETYRQPNSWVPHYSTASNSRQTTTRDKLILSSRHSIPLTSSRTRDLLLGDSQAQYPLKPIRREDAESPHKFNNKLGAAKNSLEVLSKVGIQTRLEKALEKEMEWNMEKFRKDRLLFSNDMKGVPFQCFNVDSNLTLGEMSLKTAREANKLAKGKQRQNNARRINALTGDMRGSDVYNSSTPEISSPRHTSTSVVNPVLHPIGHPLVEETETHVISDSTKKLVGQGRDPNQTGVKSSSDNTLKSSTFDVNSMGNEGVLISKDGYVDSQGQAEINNNNNNILSKEMMSAIDSSRIETNVAYLENLQLKSAQGYNASSNANPSLNLAHTERAPTSGMDTELHNPTNNEQLSPSQHSEYTSHHDQSLLPSQRVSPHSVSNSPLVQQLGQQHVDPQLQSNDSHNSQGEPSTDWPNQGSESNQNTQPLDQQSSKRSLPNELQIEQPLTPNDDSFRKVADTTDQPKERDNSDTKSDKAEAVPIEGVRRQPVVAINNSSPMTSSGFESQTTTDQEDELSPSSDQVGVFAEEDDLRQSQNNPSLDKTVIENESVPISQSINEPSDLKNVTLEDSQNKKEFVQQPTTISNNETLKSHDYVQIENKDIANCDKKETSVVHNNLPSPKLKHPNMTGQYSPDVDEGIGLVPTEAAVLDSSVTEVCSEQGVTGIADNGDSGVSTTFLTSEDSVPGALEGVAVS